MEVKKFSAKNLSTLGNVTSLDVGNVTSLLCGNTTSGNTTSLNSGNVSRGLYGSVTKKKVQIAAIEMRRVEKSFEEVMELKMSPAQREVFIVVDEWWKKFGYSPTIRDIAFVRGKMGLGCTHKIVDRLVKLGALKKVKGQGRSIRPCYINFKHIE